jgi:integrase
LTALIALAFCSLRIEISVSLCTLGFASHPGFRECSEIPVAADVATIREGSGLPADRCGGLTMRSFCRAAVQLILKRLFLVLLLLTSCALGANNRSTYIPNLSSYNGAVPLDSKHQQIFVAWENLDSIDDLSTADYHLIHSIQVPCLRPLTSRRTIRRLELPLAQRTYSASAPSHAPRRIVWFLTTPRWGFATKQRWTRESPLRNARIPSDSDALRKHIITASEEKYYFLRVAKNKNVWDLARLMRNQGMRPKEALSLGKAELDLERGQLHIQHRKCKAARRTLDLTAESRSVLARRMEKNPKRKDSPWIFPSPTNPGQHIQRLNCGHDAAIKEDKENGRKALNFLVYDFRHTFATRLAQAGADLATLVAVLGRSSIRIVHKYVHPTAEHKRQEMLTYEQTLMSTDEFAAKAEQTREN